MLRIRVVVCIDWPFYLCELCKLRPLRTCHQIPLFIQRSVDLLPVIGAGLAFDVLESLGEDALAGLGVVMGKTSSMLGEILPKRSPATVEGIGGEPEKMGAPLEPGSVLAVWSK